MSIIRAPRPKSNWYTLDKRISEDSRLSWAARGLLIFLLGKPDHWEVSVKHLINQTENAIGKSSGRDAVRVILKELEKAGYLVADLARGEGGAFSGMAYTVREIAESTDVEREKPETGFPAPAKPTPAKPAPENPHQVKTERKQPIQEEAKTDSEFPTAAVAAAGELMESPLVIEAGGKRYEIPANLKYPGPNAKTHKVWINYAICYQKKYGAWPLWNATVAGLISRFIGRVGADVAPKVAAFYVGLNDAYVLKQGHDIKTLLAGAEKYHTQYMTGRAMTETRARQIDQTQSNYDATSEAMALLEQRRAEHATA